MKKLLIMTGVAAFAFGAFATQFSSEGFEEMAVGKFTPKTFWNDPDGLEASIANYKDGEVYTGELPAGSFGNSNTNYLAIESASTATPLNRYLDSQEAVVDIDNGLYLDTLVKFTASTETMGTSDTAAKLAIWAQTSDENLETTNFVVQAGYVTANNVTSTNYVMTAPANFDFTAWHRLTVKAIGDIGGGYVGFVVFVDGTALTRANSAAIGDDGYVPTLNTVASQFADAVLPSIIHTGVYKTTLQAVSFSGTGGIDDILFTDVAPRFAADATVYTVTWGEGIAGVSCGGTALVKGAENTLPEGSFDLVVTLKSGYELDEHTASTDGCTVELKEGADNTYTVTGAQAGTAITFTAFQPKASVVVDGKTKNYKTLKAAFEAVMSTGGTITLKANMTVGGEDVIVPEESAITVTIDLAGKKVTGSKEAAVFTAAGGTLIIEDSVGGGEVVADNDGYAIYFAGGNVTVNGGKFTGSFELDPGLEMALSNYLVLNGGSYDAATWTKEALDKVKAPEATVSDEPTEDGYYTVGGDEPVVETAIAVPTAEPNLTYNGAEQIGVAAGTGYTLTGNTATKAGEYTATATLVEGYKWNDETKEPKSINWTIAKKSVEATITLTTDSATYDAEKKTVGDYTGAVTVSFGDDALSEGTDYTVTGLDATVEAAGEFTVTVEPVEGGNYSFESASAKLTVTAVPPPEPVKVEPGATAESDTEAAAKAVEFVAPAAVTEAGVDAEKYAALFEQKTSYNKTSGKWETTYELTAKAVDDLTDEVDADVKEITPTAAEASFTGTPGIYYHTVSGTSVNDLTGDNNWVMADDKGSVTLTLPKAGGKSGFYKIEASATTK